MVCFGFRILKKGKNLLFCAALFSMVIPVPLSSWAKSGHGRNENGVPEDTRYEVEMPSAVREVLKRDMLSQLSAINDILGYLSEGDMKRAAKVAETWLGESSMKRHASTGMTPERFMRSEMQSIGSGMHRAASEFAEIALEGDIRKTYLALQEVTAHCVSCHNTFRIR